VRAKVKKINDNYPKFLISLDEIKINHPKGIIYQNIWEFVANL